VTTPLFPTTLPGPEQDGYRLRRGNESVSIRLDGGASRVRRDVVGASHTAECTWLLDHDEYTALTGFFRERLQSRTRLFRIPLLIDTAVTVNYLARPLDAPEELGSTRGRMHTVRATLEVIPNPIKSFGLLLQSIADARVVDAGSVDYSGEMAQFPVGRQVLLTGCRGLSNAVAVDLDGTYTILSKPNAFSIILNNAAAVNSDWTVLNGTASQALFPTSNQGACILLPE
jgi:hypothetical protein